MAKKLYRSHENKMIAGVCGGIAEYFDTDPVWIRLIMVLLVLINGIGLILYLLMWIIVPENPSQKPKKKTVAEQTVKKVQTKDRSVILGVILVLVGAAFLMDNLFRWFTFDYIWPIGLIFLGVYFLLRKEK